MRIAVLSDTHLTHFRSPGNAVNALENWLVANTVDVLCIAGDIAEIALLQKNAAIKKGKLLRKLLTLHNKTLFVLGNHDLWSSQSVSGVFLNPRDAMERHMRTYFKWGIPLEMSWDDRETVFRMGDVTFIGSMGFPDFEHPFFAVYKNMLNKRGTTNDISYMKILPLGWLYYTQPMVEAFSARLDIAVSDPSTKTIVVVTHYGIFERQTRLNRDDVSPYFFNHSMGLAVIDAAEKHPDKTFLCVSGHSHEYCVGKLEMAFPNVYCYGHINNYGEVYVQPIEFLDGGFLQVDGEMLYKEGYLA